MLDKAPRAVTAALADTFFPPDPEDPEVPAGSAVVPEALEDLLAGLEAGKKRELAVGLHLFELGALPLHGRPFSRLGPDLRARYLRGWMMSRLAFRRGLYVALKGLFSNLYYADPRSWPMMGYPGPPLLTRDRREEGSR